MLTTDARSGEKAQSQELEVVELHWMKEPDIAMHDDAGVAVPALCGVWMEPDEPLAAQITSGRARVVHVSCQVCDLLHDQGMEVGPSALSA